MAEELIVSEQQQVPAGDPPAKRALYDKLQASQLYTKSYEDFEKQYSTPDAIGKLYDGLSKTQLYTKSRQDFDKQYFSSPTTAPQPKDNGIPKFDMNFKMPKQASESTAILHLPAQTFPFEKFEKEKKAATERLLNTDLRAEIKNLLYKNKSDAYTTELLLNARVDNTANAQLMQRIGNIIPNPTHVTDEEVNQKIEETKNDPALTQGLLVTKARTDNKTKSDLYILSAKDRIHNAGKILKNAKDIAEGKIDYNPATDQLIRPQTFTEGIKSGWEERQNALKGYDFVKGANDNQIIEYLKKAPIPKYGADEPIPDRGSVYSMIGSEGLATLKSLGTAGVIEGVGTLVPGLGNAAVSGTAAWAAALVNSPEYYKRAYFNSLYSNFHSLVDEGKSENDALIEAKRRASFDAITDAASNIAMTYAGIKTGIKKPVISPTYNGIVRKIAGKTKNFITESLPEAAAVSAVSETGQIIKNINSDKPALENLGETILPNLGMMYGIKALTKAASKAGSYIFKNKADSQIATQNVINQPDEVLHTTIGEMVQDGNLTPDEANEVTQTIADLKAEDSKIPSHITDDKMRLAFKNKMQEYESLQMQLKGGKDGAGKLTDGVAAPLKERAAQLEEDMQILAAPPEQQIKMLTQRQKELQAELDADKLAKSEGKPSKILNRDSVKNRLKEISDQLKEVTDKVNSPEYKAEQIIKPHLDNVSGVFKDMAKQDPEGFLKFVAEQAQSPKEGFDEAGNKVTLGTHRESMEAPIEEGGYGLPKKLVDQAIEMFPAPKAEPKPESGISVIMPNETPKNETFTIESKEPTPTETGEPVLANETIATEPTGTEKGIPESTDATGSGGAETASTILEPNKIQQDATEIKEPATVDVRQSSGNGEAMDGGNAESKESTGESTSKESENTNNQEVGGGRTVGISHERTNQLAREYGLPEYEGSPERVSEWWEQARKRLQNPEELQKLLWKLRLNQQPDHVETLMMLDYIASLDAKLQEAPTPELLAEFTRAKDLANIAHRMWGKQGVAMQQVKTSEDTLGSYFEKEAASRGYETLSQAELDALKAKFEKGQAAKKAYEEGEAKLRMEEIDRKAENAIRKARGVRKKPNKTKEDFEAERASIREAMREKIKKAREKANTPDAPKAMGVGGRTKIDDLFLVAPEIAKMVTSYVDQGIVKLGDLVSKIKGELEDFEGITDEEVRGLIAGEYAKPTVKKSDLQTQVADLKMQAALANKLERLLSGEQPKTEAGKKKRSEATQKLIDRIKEVEKRQKAAEKNIQGIKEKYGEEPPDPFADQKVDGRKLKQKQQYYLKQIAALKEEWKSGNFKIEPERKKAVKLDEKTQKYQDEYIKFLKETEERRQKAEFDRLSKWEKMAIRADNLWNIKRQAQTSIDVSYPFRQGITLMANPRQWDVAGRALVEMFKAVKNQENYDRKLFEMRQDPLFKEMEDAGVHITEEKGKNSEEEFGSNYLYQIPLLGKAFLKSSRAASAFSNVARFERYAKLKRVLDKAQIPETERAAVNEASAKWVNNLTGRGNMPAFLETPSGQKWMGRIFFGARLMASRFNLINPKYYVKMPKAVRVEALKDMTAFALTMIATSMAVKAAGAEISLDPDSPDFLKYKWGDKRYDLTGGLGKYIGFISNLGLGAGKAAGRVVGLTDQKELEKEGRETGNQTWRFFKYKFAPNLSDIISLGTGKDPVGQEYDPIEFFKVYPMYVDDLRDAWKDEGLLSIGTVLAPSLVGIGVQDYEDKKGQRKGGGGAGASGSYGAPKAPSAPKMPTMPKFPGE